MTHANNDDVTSSTAPFLSHVHELRRRLIYSVCIFFACMVACFYLADSIFNILLKPLAWGSGKTPNLIYTAPQEYFFTQLKIAVFGGFFCAFPACAVHIYRFVAPGLYKNERAAFRPYLIATYLLFIFGALVLYFLVLPLAMHFFVSMERTDPAGAQIVLLPRVSDYLSFVMTLIIAFGICFQLPVVLTLCARAGLVTSVQLKQWRRYAIVIIFAVAAVLTPPDLLSQFGLALPTLLLYEVSVYAVRLIEKSPERKSTV